MDIFELQRVYQRLEAVGHRHCRVRIDDENRAHLVVSRGASSTVFTHGPHFDFECESTLSPQIVEITNHEVRLRGDQGLVYATQ